MGAGLAALRTLVELDAWTRLEALGAALEAEVTAVLARSTPGAARFVRCGSLFWVYLGAGALPRAVSQFDPLVATRFRTLFRALLEGRIYYPPSAFETGFLSLAHDESDVRRFAAVLEEALAR
jgi:glutamate-1-semialdehyde 2,1-aminomutase